jgi:hypothetical protein
MVDDIVEEAEERPDEVVVTWASVDDETRSADDEGVADEVELTVVATKEEEMAAKEEAPVECGADTPALELLITWAELLDATELLITCPELLDTTELLTT